MNRAAGLLAVGGLIVAGCTSSGRYLVDGDLLRLVSGLPPLAVRTGKTSRTVGAYSTVQLECLEPGDTVEPATYRVEVEGPAGTWRTITPGPTRTDGLPCDEPHVLDEVAEMMALRYRTERGAVPAERADDHKQVFLSPPTLRLETRDPTPDGRISVEAGATNVPYILANILGGVGTALLTLGIVFTAADGSCGGDISCPIGGSDAVLGNAFLAVGAATLVGAGLVALFGLVRPPQEVLAGRSDRLYFALPRATPSK